MNTDTQAHCDICDVLTDRDALIPALVETFMEHRICTDCNQMDHC